MADFDKHKSFYQGQRPNSADGYKNSWDLIAAMLKTNSYLHPSHLVYWGIKFPEDIKVSASKKK